LNVDRRTVLIGGGAGVGLVVAYALWPGGLRSALATGPDEQAFGYFIKVARGGEVTVAVPQAETGQGIWTALPQIVADELGAAWDSVAVEPAPLDPAYANSLVSGQGWLDGVGTLRAHKIASDGRTRITAGSTSVRAFAEPLREAAAIARAMLVGAAADRWNIDASECETADGLVIGGGRTFTFGELAEEAAGRSAPHRAELRQSTKSRLLGQPLPRLDAPGKSNGSLRFAGDVRFPGMLFASVRVAPPGGRLTGFSRDAGKRVPGARRLIARDGWIAAVADTWWAAEQALHAADPKFSGTATATDMRALFDEALANGSRKRFRRGDYDSAVEGLRPLTATYFVGPSQHFGLEPLTATAHYSRGRLEVWAPTQAPGFARIAAARAGRVGASDVALYPMPVGAPSGRAIEADAIPYAAELARELGAPVQVTLSHHTSQNRDVVSPGAIGRMTALPGAAGITAAWKMEIATSDAMGSAIARLLGVEDKARIARTAIRGIPPYAIPNVTVEAVHAALPFATGYMRGSPERELAFFAESFIDELARAASMEPLAFRMSMLGSNGRLARCLQAAARRAQWDGGARGSTMGIAGCSAYGSHIGLVATASIGEDQRVKVRRLVAAVDCGEAVNSGLATQQIEAGLIWALAQASLAPPEWVAGMPRARPIGAVGLPRIGDTPEIIVDIIRSGEPPGGVSGLGVAVLAPAVANAIFAGSGRRLRSLPFDLAAA
jgi:isoquinoline 1-oxidoreductase beta subunit